MNNNLEFLEWITPCCGLPAVNQRHEDELKRLKIRYVLRDGYCVIFDPNIVQSQICQITGIRNPTNEMAIAAKKYYIKTEVYKKVVLPFLRKEFDELFSSTSED